MISRRPTEGAEPDAVKVARPVLNGGREETCGNATRLAPTQPERVQTSDWSSRDEARQESEPLEKLDDGVFHRTDQGTFARMDGLCTSAPTEPFWLEGLSRMKGNLHVRFLGGWG